MTARSSTADIGQATRQGGVACDQLMEPEATVRYWPKSWAAGSDAFTYDTTGGTATVTVVFTDSTPSVPAAATATDEGSVFGAYRWRRTATDSRLTCTEYSHEGVCIGGWIPEYTYTYSRVAGGFSQVFYGGSVPITAPADLDGDYRGIRATRSAAHPGLQGRVGIGDVVDIATGISAASVADTVNHSSRDAR